MEIGMWEEVVEMNTKIEMWEEMAETDMKTGM